MSKIKLSDYVMTFLEQKGIDDIFMLSGGGCIHLVDSVGSSNLNYICSLHEQAAAISAEAYAQYTNKPSALLVTTGPGGTNALTGVASAWLDSIPMFVLSGQVSRKDMKLDRGVRQIGFQELDLVKMVESITKYATTVMDASDIRYAMEKAWYETSTGRRGPVWVDIPLDVQSTYIDPENLRGFTPPEAPNRKEELKKKISQVFDLINNSQRPIFLAGNGIRAANAEKAFDKLIKKLQIPVLTTWKGMDFLDEEDPLFVGRPGIAGQRGANFSQQNSDLFISIGARLDLGQTAFNHTNFARAAKKVICDIDPAEINKMEFDIDCRLDFDAGEVIEEMLRQSTDFNKSFDDWIGTCKEWQERYPVVTDEHWNQPDCVNNYALVDVLSQYLTSDDLFVLGSSGASSEVTCQAFKVKKGIRIFNSQSLGSMGFGIPASIGGCVASKNRHTICIDGDGGFVLNIQELETLRRLNLPIKYFILNNNGYTSIRNTQNKHFEQQVASGESSGVTLPDFEKVVKSYGLQYRKISDHSNIHQEVEDIMNSEGPIICEIQMLDVHITAPRTSTYKKKNGEFASAPMEDLWPFLPREEFEENMIIGVLDD
tara:strand:- start:6045 stop:7841 length:1797 start_codon:yes stop_codon:yes gene_type:complete